MLTTRFTQLVGCSRPIQQAGMGPLANPRLAAVISNAGGLGMISVSGLAPDEVTKNLDAARDKTTGPIGANFLMPFVDPATAHAFAQSVIANYTDIQLTLENFFGEGDRTAVRSTVSVRVTATGQKVTYPVLNIMRWNGDKIAERWELSGPHEEQEQAGILP